MSNENIEPTGQGKPDTLSFAANARRRILLKGLGKGSAALAVAVPIQTLAATTIIGGTKLCTVSGVQSNIGSHNTGEQTTCSGYSPSYYAILANWPGYTTSPNRATNTVDGITFTESDPFAKVFGSGSSGSSNAAQLFTIVQSGSPATEQVWVTALLNAIKNPVGFNFPYTPTQVRAFYIGGGQLATDALAFFHDYMQTRQPVL